MKLKNCKARQHRSPSQCHGHLSTDNIFQCPHLGSCRLQQQPWNSPPFQTVPNISIGPPDRWAKRRDQGGFSYASSTLLSARPFPTPKHLLVTIRPVRAEITISSIFLPKTHPIKSARHSVSTGQTPHACTVGSPPFAIADTFFRRSWAPCPGNRLRT